MGILLRNATYVDWESLEFSQTDVYVEEGPGKGVRLLAGQDGHGDAPVDPDQGSGLDRPQTQPGRQKPAAHSEIDCGGALVMQAFAVGHHHVYSALARGMPASPAKPRNFREILKNIWWRLDKCLDEESIRYSALVTAMAAARAGASFVIDHHASPGHIGGSLDLIADAFEEVGVGHLLCYEVTDRDGKDKARDGLRETESYLKRRQGLVGLHASFTVGDETLYRAVNLMKESGSGIHMHVAEDLYDQEHCLKTYRKRVVHRLSEAGVLDSPKTILVHGLHLEGQERDLIRQSPCWVAQNMESNLKNRVGFFSGVGLGDRIMLGTDGMHSDMIQSLKAAFFAGQKSDGMDHEDAYRRFRNPVRYVLNNHFRGCSRNDLVVLDYDHPTEIGKHNFIGHLLFGINASHVRDVIVEGKCIVRDRVVQTVDQQAILEKSRVAATKLWNSMQR